MSHLDEQIAEALTHGPDALTYILAQRVRELEARPVVIPNDTFTLDVDESGNGLVRITINSKNRSVGYALCGTLADGHFSRRTFDVTPYLAHCLDAIGIRTLRTNQGGAAT